MKIEQLKQDAEKEFEKNRMDVIELMDGLANGRFTIDKPQKGYVFDEYKRAFITKEDFDKDNENWVGEEALTELYWPLL